VTKEVGNRNLGIELLRIVLMLMIISFHVFSYELRAQFPFPVLFLSKQLVVSYTSMAVDCFVFISGFYAIRFKFKTVVSLLVQAWFYSLIIGTVFYCINPDQFAVADMMKAILPVSSSSWWFLTTYMLLYVMSPFINYGIEALSQKQYKLILCCLFYLNCFSNFVFDKQVGGDFFNFIFLYVLARYIAIYSVELKHPLLLFISSGIVIFVLNIGFSYLIMNYPFLPAARYTSPLVIIEVVSLFFVFKNLSPTWKGIKTLAPLCFGVYLFHFHYLIWPIIHVKISYFSAIYCHEPVKLLMILVVFVISIFVISLCVEKVRQIICSPLLKFLDRKLDKFKLNI
jgi:hypothetical protein